MRVFVAGATGVIGQRAVAGLVSAGHEVTGIARTPAEGGAVATRGRRTGRGVVVRTGRTASRGRRARRRREPGDEDPVADPGRAEGRVGGERAHPRRRLAQPRRRRARGGARVRSCRSRSRSCTASTATTGSTRRPLRSPSRRITKPIRAAEANVARFTDAGRPRCRAALRRVPSRRQPPHTRRSSTPRGAESSSTSDARMAICPRSTPTTRPPRSCGPSRTHRPACTTSSTTNRSRGGRWHARSHGQWAGGACTGRRDAARSGQGRSARRRRNASRTPASGTRPGGSRRTHDQADAIERMVAEVGLEPALGLGARVLALAARARRAWRSAIYASFLPRQFYDDFPFGRQWVSHDGPYNEHLVRDFGAMNLALATVTLVALYFGSRAAARAAAAGWLVFSVPHAIYHFRHLGHYETADQIGNVVSLSLGIALAVAALVLTAARRAPADRSYSGAGEPVLELPDAELRDDDLRRDVGTRGWRRGRSISDKGSLTPTVPTRSSRPRSTRSAPGTTSIRRASAFPRSGPRSPRTNSASTGSTFDADTEVLVTAGATEAIAAALLALCEPGDEVVTFEPYYDSYAACIALAGAERRVVTLRSPHVRLRSRRASAPRSRLARRLILLNSPHNPTGKVFTAAELGMIADVAVEHDLLVVTDEVYEHLVYDGAHVPIATPSRHAGPHGHDLVGWQDVLLHRLEGRVVCARHPS